MALSVTYLPDTLTTNAVWFGCDLESPDMYDPSMTMADIIQSRLRNSDTLVFHPMMLPTIFADIERERQIELVRDKLAEMGERIEVITNIKYATKANPFGEHTKTATSPTKKRKKLSRLFRRPRSQQGLNPSLSSSTENSNTERTCPSNPPLTTGNPTAKLWQEISRLKIGLSNWQRQLVKMISFVEHLNRVEYPPQRYNEPKRLQFHNTGERIRDRLQELVDEYDEYIRECSHIMEGFTLATQLEISQISRCDAQTNQEISQVNLEVAQMTRRDGSIMKSIALLGMVFLPASFATAVFSMGFFDVPKEAEDGAVSSLIWKYIVVALMLTLCTVGIFYLCISKGRKEKTTTDRSLSA
ncbi:hypothetical protein CSPX01_09582 [Colletotrichum filicis]|nr:hypothetical protein CSPX01_09582 [Colletotrichum filicis]